MTPQPLENQPLVLRATRVLTVPQIRMLLDVAKGSHLEALLVLAVATGISRGEVLALRWSDLDLGTQTLCIHRTVHWTGKTGYVEQEPKTPARRRTIPLPRRAGDALTQLHQQQEEEQQQRGEQWQRSDLVFSMPEGTYLAAGTLTQEIAQLLRQAELPPLQFHDLRRSTASLLLTEGISPLVVQKLLGLSTMGTPVQTLSSLPFSLMVEAMKVMDRLLGQDDQEITTRDENTTP